VFLTISEFNQFFAILLVEVSVIEKDEHFAFGVTSGKDPNYKYPSEQDYLKDYENTLNYYTERLQKNTENKETKICVIGHTHHPYINTEINDGKHIYIDAGAWTAGRSDFVVITNEEVGICCYKR